MTNSFPTRRSSYLRALPILGFLLSFALLASFADHCFFIPALQHNHRPDQGNAGHCRAAIAQARDEPTRAVAACADVLHGHAQPRSEEHTSELQSLMRISSAVFCLQKKN